MKATEELKAEHRVIARVLGSLELAAGKLEQGQAVRPQFFLFTMADRVIPPQEHDAVAAAFARVEHHETGPGIHQKYVALAEALEREAKR